MSRTVDSAWRRPRTQMFGACLDNRRWASGAVEVLEKEAVSWVSRMPAVTASGTSKKGYIALLKAVKDVLFLRQVQKCMKPSMRIGAVNVFEDNEGAMKLAINRHASRRTKHIDARHNLGRGACDAGKIRVVYVRTEDWHANLFTMPLDIQTFHKHAKTNPNVVWYEPNVGGIS